MWSLFSGLWSYLFSKPTYNLVLLGLDNAGKTTLLEQLKSFPLNTAPPSMERLHKIPATVGLNIGRLDFHQARVVIWDLGGAEDLRSIWENYYSDAHGVIFVVDSSDERRFDESKVVLDTLLNHTDLREAPFLIFANKQDLNSAVHVNKLKSSLGIYDSKTDERNSSDHNVIHYKHPPHAKTHHNITRGVHQNNSISSSNSTSNSSSVHRKVRDLSSNSDPQIVSLYDPHDPHESLTKQTEIARRVFPPPVHVNIHENDVTGARARASGSAASSSGGGELGQRRRLHQTNRNIKILPTSAIKRQGINDGLDWIMDAVSRSSRTKLLLKRKSGWLSAK